MPIPVQFFRELKAKESLEKRAAKIRDALDLKPGALSELLFEEG
jgi:hypothetical protein